MQDDNQNVPMLYMLDSKGEKNKMDANGLVWDVTVNPLGNLVFRAIALDGTVCLIKQYRLTLFGVWFAGDFIAEVSTFDEAKRKIACELETDDDQRQENA